MAGHMASLSYFEELPRCLYSYCTSWLSHQQCQHVLVSLCLAACPVVCFLYSLSVVIWMEVSPIGSGIGTLGPQLVVLFRELMEPLGDGALLKENITGGGIWGFRDLPYILFSLCLPLSLSFMSSPPWWTLSPWNLSQNNHFVLNFLLVIVFYYSNIRVAFSPFCRCEVVPYRCVDGHSLTVKDTEHLFLPLLTIFLFSLWENTCCDPSLAHVLIVIFEFLLLHCKSFPHILCASLLFCNKRTITYLLLKKKN